MRVMEPLAWIVLRLGAVGPPGNPAEPGSCRGRYHTDRQPGERRTLRYERCKVAVCGLSGRSRAAMSGTWRLTAN
jgi:hypothetical protein